MSSINHVGIDVSATTLTAARVNAQGALIEAEFSNDEKGHTRLLAWATPRGQVAHCCVEATGLYSLPVALALHAHPPTRVMVVNPRASKAFAQALMQRAKTDRTDALVLQTFCRQMPFTPWQPPPDEVLQLQALMRRIDQLKGMLQQERNRRHASTYRPSTTQATTANIEAHCAYLQTAIDEVEHQAWTLVHQQAPLRQRVERLLSIKGIARRSALRILAEVLVLPSGLAPEQWVAQAGLDPRPKESGATVDAPRMISRMGNKYLRHALYMPALVAVRHQPHVQAFYQKLIAKGKKKKQALVAVMRKLLRSIWAMIQYDQDFDGAKFYQIPAQSA